DDLVTGVQTCALPISVERFDYGTPDGYRFFLDLGAAANAQKYFADEVPTWNDHMAHPTYDDYWQARNVPKDLDHVTHPVLIVAEIGRASCRERVESSV